MSGHSVIAATFSEESKAYQALSELQAAGRDGRVDVLAAGVVARNQNGVLSVPEADDNVGGGATIGGSLIGLLIGIIGGPIGMLFGWTTGALVGGAFDFKRADDTNDVLGEMSNSIAPGTTAVVAELGEVAPEVVDGLIGGLGGTVYRRSADVVLAELEAAEEAYAQAQKEANKVAREQRKAERRANFEERKEGLKSRLGIS